MEEIHDITNIKTLASLHFKLVNRFYFIMPLNASRMYTIPHYAISNDSFFAIGI